jgi:3,4-dihydroxy-2-butanone 4-phosphate synthase
LGAGAREGFSSIARGEMIAVMGDNDREGDLVMAADAAMPEVAATPAASYACLWRPPRPALLQLCQSLSRRPADRAQKTGFYVSVDGAGRGDRHHPSPAENLMT